MDVLVLGPVGVRLNEWNSPIGQAKRRAPVTIGGRSGTPRFSFSAR